MNRETQLGRPIEILLVEDNPGDVDLTREGLAEGKIRNNLWVAQNGDEALEFLYRRGNHTKSPRPDLVILDLNLPGKGGHEILQEIKGNDELRRIPVVILTSSRAEEDILRSYDLHANCFVSKPVDFEQFSKAVLSIEEFWFTVVKLPREP